MKIAYLILAHKNPLHLTRLMSALQTEYAHIFVHIDKKSDDMICPAIDAHVTVIQNTVTVTWGGFSVVQATLNLMQEASALGEYEYFILLSGADYPIRSHASLLQFFQDHEGEEFISLWKMPALHKPFSRVENVYIEDPHGYAIRDTQMKRPYPQRYAHLTLYAGSQWWALSKSCVNSILQFVAHNAEFVNFYKNTFVPDEMFFHTIIGNSPFHKKVTNGVMYDDWVTGSPAAMTFQHLPILAQETVAADNGGEKTPLFARKFSDESQEVITEIEHLLRNDEQANRSQPGDLTHRQQEKAPMGWLADSPAKVQKTRKPSTGGMSRAWGIQSVYLPRENLRFIEEWLAYHSQLGAQYFYLYDNTGSQELLWGNSVAVNGKNKYDREIDRGLTDDEIADLEAEIFKKYPVTKVKWQPRHNGQIVFGQAEACDHFSDLVQAGWCAFIDMDEFLYSPYDIGDILEGKAIVLFQKKFDDRFGYHCALEITKTFSIKTDRWAGKLLINMEHYVKGAQNIHDLNVYRYNEPLFANMDEVRFNHYNHNRKGHEWLLRWYQDLDPNWQPVPFEEVFNERCELVWNRATRIDYASFVRIPLPGSVC